jgi:hypothetical protein
MRSAWGVTFALLFVSMTPSDQADLSLLSKFKFQWSTRAPGNAIAFKTTLRRSLLCTQGSCYKTLLDGWTFIPTKMNHSGNIGLLLQNGRKWVTEDFEIESTLFERNQKHYIDLRLPATVIKEIDNSGEDIFVNRQKDQELFKIVTLQPLSTHWQWPVQTVITSEFSSPRKPPSGRVYAHTGVDLRAPWGTKVRACSDGIVIDEEKDPIYGNVLTIDHGRGILSRYMHLSHFEVQIGDVVKGGELIALSGNTGRSEAPHLHWEMRLRGQAVNPIATTLLLEHLAYLE